MEVLSRAKNLFLAHGVTSAPGVPAPQAPSPPTQSILLVTLDGVFTLVYGGDSRQGHSIGIERGLVRHSNGRLWGYV